MTRYVILTWFLIALVLVTPALAGNCHQLYHHKVQAVVLAQPLYFAGQALHDEATIRKAIRAELPAIIQQLQAQPQQQRSDSVGQVTSQTFAAKCAKCHKGDTALTSDPSTFKAFARMAGLGEGIPNEMRAVIGGLTPAEKGELTEYLLRMPPPFTANNESPPPPPQPEGRLE